MTMKTLGNRDRRRYTPGSTESVMPRVSARTLLVAVGVTCLLVTGCSSKKNSVPPAGNVAPGDIAALGPAPTPEVGPDYKIQVGDELHVRFLHHPEMNEQLPVRPDGRISLGATGQMEVVGLTPAQLEQMVVTKSSDRLRNPVVTVVVTKVGEQRVYVGGEVGKPGYVTLRNDMTLLQAVLQSGDFRRTAKLDGVLLLTPQPGGTFSAARVNMEQVVDEGVPERVRLRPNDIVYVPPSTVGEMINVVDLYVRGLIPVLPRVGVGYSLSGQ